MSAAPALFKWIRSRHPGVSRRQRSSSAGAEGREGEVPVVMSGKVAGWAAGLKSSRSRLKPRLGGALRSGRGRGRAAGGGREEISGGARVLTKKKRGGAWER